MTIMSLMVSALILAGCVYFYMVLQLPDVETLKDMRLQVPLRIYSSDGELIGEYGAMRRNPVTLEQVPKQLINAVIATEDRRFFDHPGVDFIGILRATRELALTGQKNQGASTITMQVARNFFLSPQKTYSRKINEVLLALKINSSFSKEKILELYLNKIYLGQHAYGVSAAAEIYYGKALDELTLSEMATIAGLPQAPSKENPITNPRAAKESRDHVLARMLEDGYIDQRTYEQTIAEPITARYHGPLITLDAPYVAEMVRNVVYQEFGDAGYTSGLQVYTTLDSKLQREANESLREGLISYEQRHGYRGPEQNLGPPTTNFSNWQTALNEIPIYNGLLPAAVISASDQSLSVRLGNGFTVNIPWSGLSWTGRPDARHIAKVGDVVRVFNNSEGQWELGQVPKVEGAIVSLNPHDGAVLALDGGFDYGKSSFNRVIQANRQPGSNFKPFIYAAALAKGYTLATIVNDAPIVLNDTGDPNNLWRPQNAEQNFNGPTRIRVALTKSLNLASIRLLQMIGIHYAVKYITRFGFDPANIPHTPSLALGTASVTPIQMADGYAVFANGGYLVTPYFIQQIKAEDGSVVYQAHPPTVCAECAIPINAAANPSADASANAADDAPNPPAQTAQIPQPTPINPIAPAAIQPDVAFLMTSVLQDVIKRGTGSAASALHRQDLAGKTGTSNEKRDAWFSGYNNNIVTTVWVGYDDFSQSLHEFGSQAALPIWMQFMKGALDGKPESAMPQPPGIITVRIDPYSGLLASPEQGNAIFEYFSEDTVPTERTAERHFEGFSPGGNSEAQLF